MLNTNDLIGVDPQQTTYQMLTCTQLVATTRQGLLVGILNVHWFRLAAPTQAPRKHTVCCQPSGAWQYSVTVTTVQQLPAFWLHMIAYT